MADPRYFQGGNGYGYNPYYPSPYQQQLPPTGHCDDKKKHPCKDECPAPYNPYKVPVKTLALGEGSCAKGDCSTAVGACSLALEDNTSAFGADSAAKGRDSTALGKGATACNLGSLAIGKDAKSWAKRGSAIGTESEVTEPCATAYGDGAKAKGENTTAIGADALACKDCGTAVGKDAKALGKWDTVIGCKATSDMGQNDTVVGAEATSNGAQDSVVVGHKAQGGPGAVNYIPPGVIGPVAVGAEALATKPHSTAVGHLSKATGEKSIAIGLHDDDGEGASAFKAIGIGAGVKASGNFSVAIGGCTNEKPKECHGRSLKSRTLIDGFPERPTSASGIHAVALGPANVSSANDATTFGQGSTASAERALAGGYVDTASAEDSTALGSKNKAEGQKSTAVGHCNLASAESSSAYGDRNRATGKNSLAGGKLSEASAENTTALGQEAKAVSNGSVAIGMNPTAGDPVQVIVTPNAIAIGRLANAKGPRSIAIGDSPFAENEGISIGHVASTPRNNGIAIGTRSTADNNSPALAIGFESLARGSQSAAISYKAQADGNNATALGSESLATQESSQALGDNAQSTAVANNAIGKGARGRVLRTTQLQGALITRRDDGEPKEPKEDANLNFTAAVVTYTTPLLKFDQNNEAKCTIFIPGGAQGLAKFYPKDLCLVTGETEVEVCTLVLTSAKGKTKDGEEIIYLSNVQPPTTLKKCQLWGRSLLDTNGITTGTIELTIHLKFDGEVPPEDLRVTWEGKLYECQLLLK